MKQRIKTNPYILGAISGCIFAILLIICCAVITDIENNKMVYNKTIIVTGKLCPVSVDAGKIQDENKETYFIPLTSCDNFTIGTPSHINYNKIHQVLSFKEFDFNRVTGRYGGWSE